MKKRLGILIILLSIFIISGCDKKEETKEKSDATKFKEEYEKLNNTENNQGKAHRNLNINENNPFIYSNPNEIISKIENKETFYVYFGSSYCPWCRSIIETTIKVANEKNIEKIYYVDIWDGDHVEILRDAYKMNEDDKIELVSEGSDEYKELLKYFDNVLNDYTLTNSKGKKVKVGEKRIFAPDFIYVEDGIAKDITDGISDKQKDSREELTEDILTEEYNKFSAFFR